MAQPTFGEQSFFLQKRIEKSLKEAEKHRAKADEHNDGVFLIVTVCAIFADILGLLAPFMGPLAILLPIISGLISSAINLFFWWYRRDVMQNFDHILMGVLSILEYFPIISALPILSVSVAVRWWISAQAAGADREKAEQNEKSAQKDMRKLSSARQAEAAAAFLPVAGEIDTSEEEEFMPEAA